MSKRNKVNPDHYQQAGRLTPDEIARERMKQQHTVPEPSHPPQEDSKKPLGSGRPRDEPDRD